MKNGVELGFSGRVAVAAPLGASVCIIRLIIIFKRDIVIQIHDTGFIFFSV
jgi:hypothetical protein